MSKHDEKLLRSKPIFLGKTAVRIPTLDEIFEIGTLKYYEYLQSIILDFMELEIPGLPEDITEFELFYLVFSSDKDFLNSFLEGLQLFTGDTFVTEENLIFSIEKDSEGHFKVKDVLTEEKWVELREVLSAGHWQKTPKKYSYKDNKAKQIMKKLQENKKLVQKIKSKNGETGLELYELVGSVAAISKSYNLFNIWGLTYYQFFDQYYRIDAGDKYKFSLQSLLAGADPKKIEIGHWASSIKNNQGGN